MAPAKEKEISRSHKKKFPIEKYYALFSTYWFAYPAVHVDKKTGEAKEAIRTNPVTGRTKYDVNGAPSKVMLKELFTPIRTKMSEGFLSEAVFDPNTTDPQKLARGEELRNLSRQDDIKVLTEDNKDQRENYAAWTEKKKRIALEGRLKTAEASASRVEGLEKKIAALEAGK